MTSFFKNGQRKPESHHFVTFSYRRLKNSCYDDIIMQPERINHTPIQANITAHLDLFTKPDYDVYPRPTTTAVAAEVLAIDSLSPCRWLSPVHQLPQETTNLQ